VALPPLNAGDNLVVHHVGAYDITQSMQFISLRPAVVIVDNMSKAHLIKRKETLQDIQHNEAMPEFLRSFKLS